MALYEVPGWPVLGVLPRWISDPWNMLLQLSTENDGLIYFRLGPHKVYFAWRPEHVKRIMTDGGDIYTRETRQYAIMRRGLGNGLVTSNGDHWRKNRRLIMPCFTKERVEILGRRIVTIVRDHIETIAANDDKAIDFTVFMTQLTLRIICSTLFSSDIKRESVQLGEHLDCTVLSANLMVSDPFELPSWVPSRRHLAFATSLRFVRSFVDEQISKRRKGQTKADDILSSLIAIRDDNGKSLTDAEIRDEAITLCVAGYETTALAVSWLAFTLSANRDIQDRVIHECRRAAVDGQIGNAQVVKLPLLHASICESMRLYPPSWLITRSVAKDDEIDGVRIPKGSNMFVSPFVNHRHPALWDSPERFNPGRFLGENKIDMYRYFPFGVGAHSCVGRNLGLFETKLIAANLLLNNSFEYVGNSEPEFQGFITLRPKDGLTIRLKPN